MALSVSVAGTVSLASKLPVVYNVFTAPLVSYAIREGIIYLFSASSKQFLGNVALRYMAETTAVNIIAQGYAPYLLGAVSGGTLLTGFMVANACYYTYKGVGWAYNKYYEPYKQLATEDNELVLKVPAIGYHPEYHSQQSESVDYATHFISRARLEFVISNYQTQSTTRYCLSFFKVMGTQSQEVYLIQEFLQKNPDIQYISLSKLAETISTGKEYRVAALLNNEKIGANEGDPLLQSGTNKGINEIIDSSITAKLKECLEILHITLNHDNQMPSNDDIYKAYKEQARFCHPDKPGGSKEKFQRLGIAKSDLENLLGYNEDKCEFTLEKDGPGISL